MCLISLVCKTLQWLSCWYLSVNTPYMKVKLSKCCIGIPVDLTEWKVKTPLRNLVHAPRFEPQDILKGSNLDTYESELLV